MEKPKNVSLAVNLLWLSVVLAIPKILIDPSTIQGTSLVQSVVVITLSLLITVFIISALSAGKNWARVVLVSLFLLGQIIALTFSSFSQEFTNSPAAGILTVTQSALQAYAIFLVLSKPGSEWFKKPTAS